MQDKTDSKELWHQVHDAMPIHDITLGRAAAATYVSDPKMLLFMASRYKFVAKMLDGSGHSLEIGCGDGFGAPLVAQSVKTLTCTDIDEETLADNATRLKFVRNLSFTYFDFRIQAFEQKVDSAYAVDVLEHIYPSEEAEFLTNIGASLQPHGTALFGTPNLAAEKYASKLSKLGHVNLKDASSLRLLMQQHFHNVFMFSMNDEVVHTGYSPMAHYLWALCVGPKRA